MVNLLTINNLQRGIQIWLAQTTWPTDLHNGFYQQLHLRRQTGLDEAWWSHTVGNLWRWKAIRPLKKGAVLASGLSSLPVLQSEYSRIKGLVGRQIPSLTNLSWTDVSALYATASAIKGVKSPVFGSKLCHFIIPDAFPVIDSNVKRKAKKAIGTSPLRYDSFWQFCQSQWTNCPSRAQLISTMQRQIGPSPFADYPYAAKITELCITGS